MERAEVRQSTNHVDDNVDKPESRLLLFRCFSIVIPLSDGRSFHLYDSLQSSLLFFHFGIITSPLSPLYIKRPNTVVYNLKLHSIEL